MSIFGDGQRGRSPRIWPHRLPWACCPPVSKCGTHHLMHNTSQDSHGWPAKYWCSLPGYRRHSCSHRSQESSLCGWEQYRRNLPLYLNKIALDLADCLFSKNSKSLRRDHMFFKLFTMMEMDRKGQAMWLHSEYTMIQQGSADTRQSQEHLIEWGEVQPQHSADCDLRKPITFLVFVSLYKRKKTGSEALHSSTWVFQGQTI